MKIKDAYIGMLVKKYDDETKIGHILDILQIYKETELVVKFGNGEIETVLPELVNPLT